jgi:hypothetical protein
MSKLEDSVRLDLEMLSRTVKRRVVLDRSIRTAFAVISSVALGSIATGQQVLADSNCACTFPGQLVCSNCPTGTVGGCPQGCTECSKNDCGPPCIHLVSHWSSCGCGTCGNGCRECWDCACPDCFHECGCRADCVCCNCCSPQDIATELRRLAGTSQKQQVSSR